MKKCNFLSRKKCFKSFSIYLFDCLEVGFGSVFLMVKVDLFK